MASEIKTRKFHRDVKALDKAATAKERIRQSYIRTKDDAEQTQEHATPVEYAEDRITVGVDTAIHKGICQAGQHGGRLAGVVKEKNRISKGIRQPGAKLKEQYADALLGENLLDFQSEGKSVCHPKEQMNKQAQAQMAKKSAHPRTGQRVSQRMMQDMGVSRHSVKTREQDKKSIKTTR